MLEAAKKLYPYVFVCKDFGSSSVGEKHQFSVPRRYKPKFYQSVYKLYQCIEDLKCMEPLEQNIALFSFLSYIVTKLDKIIEKSRVLNKLNGAMFEKA